MPVACLLIYLSVLRCLTLTSDALGTIETLRESVAPLALLADGLVPCKTLARRLADSIDEEGTVKDKASGALGAVRRRLLSQRAAIRKTVNGMAESRALKDVLAEPIVATRDNRLVLPVRAGQRPRVRGILRGRSSSGQMVYIEPLEAVRMGDRIPELEHEEREEVRRILRLLSEAVRERLQSICENGRILTELDACKAAGRLARLYDGVVPDLSSGERLSEIRGGRHPLLCKAVRPLLPRLGLPCREGSEVVPVSVRIPADRQGIVITGPNTGGKTATLKLIGLLHAMAQSGFLVPAAAGTVLMVYDSILADIGDDQSLAENLSTFSAHLSRLARFFRDLRLPALLLVDELGAGTDPKEGEALGVAIIEEFLDRGAHLAASTHLGGLKSHALSSPRLQCVAMGWDEKTLQPTFELLRGAAGSSHALAIARRMDLPPAVLDRATRLLAASRTDREKIEQDLAGEFLRVETERDMALSERREIESLRQELRVRQERLLGREAEVGKEVGEFKRKIEAEVRATLRELRRTKSRRELDRGGEAALASVQKMFAGHRREIPPASLVEPPAVGDSVRLLAFGKEGIVEAVESGGSGTTVTVRVGDLAVKARLGEIAKGQPVAPRTRRPAVRRPIAELPSQELLLIGMRVEEALIETDTYLDRALNAGADTVRIVHGFGTGRLRRALQDHLRSHPLVRDFRAGDRGEGGGGATVVRLR